MIEITEVTVGQAVVFAAYAQETDNPMFAAGDKLVIVELSDDVENNGFKVQSVDDETKVEMLFNDEVDLDPEEEEEGEEEAAEAEPEAPAAKETKAKATKTAAKVAKPKNKAPVAEAKLAAPATAAKGKKGAKLATPAAQTEDAEEKQIVIKDTEKLAALMAESNDAMQSARDLNSDIEESFFTLGGVLLHIHHDGLFKNDYPEKGGFEKFCEEELNLGGRKARDLMNIYRITTDAGFDEVRLSKLGWTKARQITREIKNTSPADFEKLVVYAESHTREELNKKIERDQQKRGAKEQGSIRSRNEVVGEQPETVKSKTFKFVLRGESATIADQAIEAACKSNGTTDINKAFEAIVTEWGTLTHGGQELTLEQYLANGSKMFGVDLSLGTAEEDGSEVEAETAEAAE